MYVVCLFASLLNGFIWEEIKGCRHEWHTNLQCWESSEKSQSHSELVCLSLSGIQKHDHSLLFLTMLLCLVLQPDLSVYYCWSPCWNYWIHWLDRLCVLLCGDVDHISWAHGQGRLLSWRVLWFMEPGPFWWLPWWPYGTLYFPFSCISSVKFLYVTFQSSY